MASERFSVEAMVAACTSTRTYEKLLSGRNCVAKENQGTVRILSLWQW